MKSENLVLTVVLISFVALYLYLTNVPSSDLSVVSDYKEELATEAERESHKADVVKSMEVETVRASPVTMQVFTSEKVQTITAGEYEEFCRVVMNEAGGESYSCQVAVAETVINRINSDDYPDTLMEVLNQPYQYSHYENGDVTDSVREAVAQVLEYQVFNNEMLYFRMNYYHSFAEDYMMIDNMYFSIKKGPSTNQSNMDLNK